MGLIEDLQGGTFYCTILVSTRGKVSENRIGFLMVDHLHSVRCEDKSRATTKASATRIGVGRLKALSDGRFWLLFPLVEKVTPPFVCNWAIDTPTAGAENNQCDNPSVSLR